MDIIEFREYCLSLPLTQEATPFDESTLVYKIGGKIYTLVDIDDFHWINVKCDPERAIELRETHEEITPGWHMNKKHWNTIATDGDLPEELIKEFIYDSYMIVVNSLPRAVREPIIALQQ